MRWQKTLRASRIVLLWAVFACLWARVLTLTSVREAAGALWLLTVAVALQAAATLAWVRHNRRRVKGGERRRRPAALAGDFSRDVLGRPVVLSEDSGWSDRELRITIEGGRKVYRAAGVARV